MGKNYFSISKCTALLNKLPRIQKLWIYSKFRWNKVWGVNTLRGKTTFQYQNWGDKSMRNKYGWEKYRFYYQNTLLY